MLSIMTTMQGLVEDAMYVYQVMITMSTYGMLVISGSVTVAWTYLMLWSTIRVLRFPSVKFLCKAINLKGRQ